VRYNALDTDPYVQSRKDTLAFEVLSDLDGNHGWRVMSL
jgi:hypothetical protein